MGSRQGRLPLGIGGLVLAAVASIGTGCNLGPGAAATAAISYSGTDCDTLAREWAQAVSVEGLAIVRGPSNVEGEGRGVRLHRRVIFATDLVNRRMRELGIVDECNADDFLRIADAAFPAELKSGVGAAAFDGNPEISYEEWLEELRRSVIAIDQEETVSPQGSAAG